MPSGHTVSECPSARIWPSAVLRARETKFAAQMIAEAAAGERRTRACVLDAVRQQIDEAIDRARIVAGRLALHQLANQRDDLGCFARANARNGCIACYNSHFPCPSWISRRSGTSCRTATRCCWWTRSSSWKRSASSASRTSPSTSRSSRAIFPTFPVMPGVLIVEAMAQVAGVLVLKQHSGPQEQAGAAGLRRAGQIPPAGAARRSASHRDEGHQAQGERRQDARHGDGGWRGGGRGRADVQAGGPHAAIAAPVAEEPVPVP